MNDKAIEYNGKLGKVQNTLERMKKIGLNISTYNELLEGIRTELDAAKTNNVKTIFTNMETDVLNMAYNKAINKLDIMYGELIKYDIYLKTASFCGSLKLFLASENHNKQELPKHSTKLLELLQEIKNSDTLDYDVEGPLVEEIYHLAYEFIKIEIRLNGTSIVLNEVSKNDTDISYIEREIIRELEGLNLKEAKYQALVNKKYEIESEGLNANLVNKELISLIVSSTTSYEEHQKLLKRLTNDFETYYKKIINLDEEIKQKISEANQREQEAQNQKREEYKKIGKQALRIITSIGLITSLAVGSFILSRQISKEKKYKVTTTTYSTISEEFVEEDYVLSEEAKNGKYLYKYEPYGEKGLLSGVYTRKVTTYDLTGSEDITLEEILELDFTSLGFVGETTKETTGELSLNDTYKEAYYILKEINVDELDTIEELNDLWILLFGILLIVEYFANRSLIEDGLDKIFKEQLDTYSLISCTKIIIDSYRRIKSENQDVETKKKEFKELIKQAHKLIIDNEELLIEIERALSNYENEKQKINISQKLERVRKMNY